MVITPKSDQKLCSLFDGNMECGNPPKLNGDLKTTSWTCPKLKQAHVGSWVLSFSVEEDEHRNVRKACVCYWGRFRQGKKHSSYWNKAAFVTTWQLQDENSEIGELFEALYRADGGLTWASPKEAESTSHLDLLQKHLPEFLDQNESTYSGFSDPDHPNMEVWLFYRSLQKSGNCYLRSLHVWCTGTFPCDMIRKWKHTMSSSFTSPSSHATPSRHKSCIAI